MATNTWNFTLDGQPHTLTLEHEVASGKCAITLDGQLLDFMPRNREDYVGRHEYRVGDHSVILVIQPDFFSFVLVDGVSLDTDTRGPRQMMSPVWQGVLLLSVILGCVFCAFSWFMKSNYDRQLAIQEWPVVTGTVTGVDTRYYQEHRESGADHEYYLPILDVEYLVDDARYAKRLADNNREYNTSSEALAAHAVGESQRLYVNPAQPQEAVIYFEKLSPTGWIGTSLGIMGMFLGVVLVMVVAVWLQTRARKPAAQNDQ